MLAFAAATAFCSKAILVKLALRAGADPIALLSVRMALAAPIFLTIALVAAWRGGLRLRPRDVAALFALGLLGFHMAAIFDFLGLKYVSAGLERVVLYVHPTLVVLFGAAIAWRRPSGKVLGGILVAWIGLAVAVSGDFGRDEPADVLRGVGLVLISAVAYAGYLLATEPLTKRFGAIFTGATATVVSAFTLGLQVGLTRPDAVTGLPREVWPLTVVLALVSTVLPVLLLAAAISRIGPARASTIGMVGPILAAVLGWLVLGEPLSAIQLLGGVVVIAGVALARPVPVQER